jgi:class 3 adenylate cyclase/pimeloyl-ACP methyl ester carboxylesterase
MSSLWTTPAPPLGAASGPRYVRSGDGHVAYQVFGTDLTDGTDRAGTDVLLINESVLPVEALLDNAVTAAHLGRLAACGRLIAFDRRGVGLSDPVSESTPLAIEDWVADAVAVLDAAGSERAAIVSWGPSAGLIALLLAHGHPGRVGLVTVYDAIARYSWAPDYPCGVTADVDGEIRAHLRQWGTSTLADRRGRFAATAARHPEFVEWASAWLRRGASPATITAQFDVVRRSDLRGILAEITCPVLVVNHAEVDDGRYLAAHLPDARYVELDDPCHVVFSPELDRVMTAIVELVSGSTSEPATQRVLSTLLFTDIVGSTSTAAHLGDRRWVMLLDEHYDMVRRELRRFGGHALNTTGDGVIALFDAPSRAVHCALAVQHAARRRGVAVRAGVHTGEIELRHEDVAGLNVHVAQRVCQLASGSQVLVSQPVADLAASAELGFELRGDHALKGVDGTWKVFEATGRRSD